MPKAKAKAKSTSKASINNVVKIVLAEKRKRKTQRRKKTARRTREDDQMLLLHALSAKPHMREVKQPDPEKEQNKLIKSALLASNVGVISALNNLNTPSFTTGYAPPPFPEAPETTDNQLGVQGMLMGLTRKKLRDIYKRLFNVSLPSNMGEDRIIDQIRLRNPSVDLLDKAIKEIHIKDNEPNITVRRKPPQKNKITNYFGGEAPF